MRIGSREMLPIGPTVAADQPKRTGSPPLNPPKRLFRALRRYNRRLYTPTLSRTPSVIQSTESRFKVNDNRMDIATSVSQTRSPAAGLILPLGMGRCLVR